MNNRYIKTIENEVTAALNEKPKRTAGKGLLSPKKTDMPKQNNKSTQEFVVSLVSDIRRKRNMIKESMQ